MNQQRKQTLKDLDTRLVAGYNLQTINGERLGVYCPALNQIWILPNISEAEAKQLVHHEINHAIFTELTPSRWMPLHQGITGNTCLPGRDEFEDIVETLYPFGWYLNQKTSSEWRPVPLALKKHQKYAMQLMDIASAIAHRSGSQLEQSEALADAGRALRIILLNTIPLKPGVMPTLLKALHTLEVPEEWNHGEELFQHLYLTFWEHIRIHPKLQSSFILPLSPPDFHDLLEDIFIYICDIFFSHPSHQEVLIPTLPSGLELLSMGSIFRSIVIHFTETSKSSVARVDILPHPKPTEKSNSRTSHMLNDRVLEIMASDCPTHRVARSLWQAGMAYAVSEDSHRNQEFLKTAMSLLTDVVKELQHYTGTCRGCQYLAGKEWQPFHESLQKDHKIYRDHFLAAAQHYETWLLGKSLENALDVLKLKKLSKVIKEYPYL